MEKNTIAKIYGRMREGKNAIKDDIIRESALLTTVSGFFFGFLLNIEI